MTFYYIKIIVLGRKNHLSFLLKLSIEVGWDNGHLSFLVYGNLLGSKTDALILGKRGNYCLSKIASDAISLKTLATLLKITWWPGWSGGPQVSGKQYIGIVKNSLSSSQGFKWCLKFYIHELREAAVVNCPQSHCRDGGGKKIFRVNFRVALRYR